MVLKFAVLRHANEMRLPQFKNKKGEPAHAEPDGSDWALSAWSNAVFGEMGELIDAFAASWSRMVLLACLLVSQDAQSVAFEAMRAAMALSKILAEKTE